MYVSIYYGQCPTGLDPERELDLFMTLDLDNSGVIEPAEFVRAFFPKDSTARQTNANCSMPKKEQ